MTVEDEDEVFFDHWGSPVKPGVFVPGHHDPPPRQQQQQQTRVSRPRRTCRRHVDAQLLKSALCLTALASRTDAAVEVCPTARNAQYDCNC